MITVIKPYVELITPAEWFSRFADILERAGRTCYKSEDKATTGTAEPFIQRIIKSGHESVIEHLSVSFLLVGDRSMSHQLVRHRIAAYSQESQRFCDYGDKGFQVVCPPDIGIPPGDYSYSFMDHKIRAGDYEFNCDVNDKRYVWYKEVEAAYSSYCYLRENNIKLEDARSILPNATKTEVFTTFNLRQWRHVIKERVLNRSAQWQIKQLIAECLIILNSYLPYIFGDLHKQYLEMDSAISF